MKKYYIVFIVLLIILSVIFFIIREKMNKVKISEEEILESNNIYVEYRRITMRVSNYYIFEINEEKPIMKIMSYKDETVDEKELSKEDIKIIKDALIVGHVNKWDGFDKSDNRVLDGEMFTFKAKINDVEIYAEGNNSFPKGYFDFSKKLNEIIKKYDIMY